MNMNEEQLIDAPIHYIVLVMGYYGIGATLREAAVNCKKAGARGGDRALVKLCLGVQKPDVAANGDILYSPTSRLITIKHMFSLRGLTK